MVTDVQSRMYDSGRKTTLERLNWGTYEVRNDSLYFKPNDQESYSNFKGHIRGEQRHRIHMYVYGAEYTFERFKIDGSFDKKEKQKLIESAIKELKISEE